MPQDELGISVLKSACSSEARDLAVDWAELGLDSLLHEGVLKDAPIFGSIVKVCLVSKTIRDKLFVRKVWDFLRACPKFNDLEKLGFAREHLEDPKKAEKLGNAIVLILDKLDDLEKPEMLAKVFASFVRGRIDFATFRRLASAIDIGFVEDLVALTKHQSKHGEVAPEYIPDLLRTGLTQIYGPREQAKDIHAQTPAPLRRTFYGVTALGEQFITCMSES
jgi:hypothetical protein